MATTEAVLRPAAKPRPLQAGTSSGIWICAALTCGAIAIHGYHPYAEDGGVYLAGIKRVLDPELYPSYDGFVTAHLHFSLFARLVSLLVHITRCPLMVAMFAIYIGTIWLILYSGWLIAARCTRSNEARVGAVCLLALMLTVPIAGTSLILMDPYVTARSISTPFGLLALVGALDLSAALRSDSSRAWRGLLLCCVALLACFVVHPLMAAYTLGCVALEVCFVISNDRLRRGIVVGICAVAVVLAGLLEELAHSAGVEYRQVALTRDYWFIQNWHSYEVFGLFAPLLVLVLCRNWGAPRASREGWDIARMCVAAGGTAMVIAAVFSRVNSNSFMVARLQPLRIYHTIYILMILALGAYLGARVLRTVIWRWAGLCITLGAGMALVQLQVFPHSNHLELPWLQPTNSWEQALQWIRTNTPRDAVFAMDARYALLDGEDTQNFRAIAERSALPDYAKDGGVASIVPALAAQWNLAESAQNGLADGNSRQLKRVRDLGANWILLPLNSTFPFDCPYRNTSVKVCKLEEHSYQAKRHR